MSKKFNLLWGTLIIAKGLDNDLIALNIKQPSTDEEREQNTNICTKTWGLIKKSQMCSICKGKETRGSKHYRWRLDREQVALEKKFRVLNKSILRNCLVRLKISKINKTIDMLGYTSQDLYNHLINHPNWLNVQNVKWHIDHYFPIKAFMDYGIFDTKIVNCLENLQPLTAKENLLKYDTYNQEEFEDWLNSKNITYIKPKDSNVI